MEDAISTPSTSHWYVADLSLSLHFHSHTSAVVATLVVFFAILTVLLVVHLTSSGYRNWRDPPAAVVDGQEPRQAYQKKLGLDAAAINSLPRFLALGGGGECSICLGVLEENDEVKAVPKCLHEYHSECLDVWLNSHASCPLCRSTIDIQN